MTGVSGVEPWQIAAGLVCMLSVAIVAGSIWLMNRNGGGRS